MEQTRVDQRFFASTRGQIATLLRRGAHTVDELAREVGLTDNAVRAHLAGLERDGLVRQGALRRGTSKPSFTYELTPDAERLFPKAYGLLLQQLLDVLVARLPRDVMTEALREVGHRLVPDSASASDDLAERVDQALELLGSLGGLAEATQTEDGYLIEGHSCPLAAAVQGSPDACLLAETLLSDLIGVPVRQMCDHDPVPRCRFAVSSAGA